MTRLILTIGALFISQVSLATQTIYVIGRGYENSFCNANYLPPNHNGTWVNCRSESRMQCEIQN